MSGLHEGEVTRVGDAVLVALPGDLTDQGLLELRERALSTVAEVGPDRLVVDASSVIAADAFLGQVLEDLGSAAALLGAEPVVAGLKPGAALTLLSLGQSLPSFRAVRTVNLALGLEEDG